MPFGFETLKHVAHDPIGTEQFCARCGERIPRDDQGKTFPPKTLVVVYASGYVAKADETLDVALCDFV